MRVFVNGAPREVPEESNIIRLLTLLELAEGKGVAVAVDGEIVRRKDWEGVRLMPNQRIEVLRAVQGG